MLTDKDKKKNKSQKCEVGNTGWMGLGKKPKRKKMYKPNGHLSSPGTKMFQSQNISLVEFQGFREKSKLKRGSQTYICVCIYIYICRETSTKSLSPWEPRTLTKGKEGIHALKSRKYGNILPFPPGSLQQRERDAHCKLLKQERTHMGPEGRRGCGTGSCGRGK